MSPEAQRIAIAEACGAEQREHAYRPVPIWRFPGSVNWCHFDDLPDYLSDLNAMHEAEKVLTDTGPDGQWAAYRIKLMSVCLLAQCDFLHATAAQRAEAFLRTLNLWKEAADVR